MDIIKLLRDDYHLFILSNTNEIHFKKIYSLWHNCEPPLEKMSTDNSFHIYNDIFLKEYYSFKTGETKPDYNAYLRVINENSLNNTETLFIDDTFENIIAAQQIGVHALYFKNMLLENIPSCIEEINNEEYKKTEITPKPVFRVN